MRSNGRFFAGMSGIVVALVLAGCAQKTATLPGAPVAAGPGIRVVAEPVAESPEPRPASRFRYAGGVALTSPDTSRLHGLSDLEVRPDGRMVAITDDGDIVRARIVLDAAGRVAGLAGATLRPLVDTEGQPLSGRKIEADAEGLAIRPNGDLMVSFERKHRIWLYPAGGGPPRAAPSPNAPFPDNDGMEALALDPTTGADAYIVGREDTRETWTCRLSGGCVPGPRAGGDLPGSLVSARPLPGGRWVYLLRDFNVVQGARIWIVITDRAGAPLDVHAIARPATVDNFEGVSPVVRKDGTIRLYILSDDNFSPSQRTLLMALDWTPPK